MTEHPILFSAPMVRAILLGTKMQTRRILKPQPPDNWSPIVEIYHPTIIDRHGVEQPGPAVFGASDEYHGCKIHWQPGDTLWVRETCRAEELASGMDGVRYSADYAFIWTDVLIPGNTPTVAEKWLDLFSYRGRRPGMIGHSVPSIHMPRWASRITLLVEAVRVERLQDISEVDAIAEGAARLVMDDDGKFYESEQRGNHRTGFAGLWDHINGPGAWDANPWVSVTTFRRIKP